MEFRIEKDTIGEVKSAKKTYCGGHKPRDQ